MNWNGGTAPFKVYYKVNGTAPYGEPTTVASGTSCILENLTQGTSYDVKVVDNNGNGTAIVQENYFTTVAAYPAPTETDLIATTTALTATIEWTAPSEDVTGYAAQYKTGEGEWINATANISGTTCNLTGLTANTAYTFQVKAIYGANSSAWTETTFTTKTPTITVAPATAKVSEGGTVNLTATVTNNESATINWTSSNATYATVSPATGASTTVTGVKEGSATITAKITVGGVDYTSTCAVSVVNEITVNNTGTSTTNSNIPFNGSWADNTGTHGQFIIPASELSAVTNGEIKKLTFYGSTNHPYTSTFVVKLAEVSQTTLSSFYDGTMITVYTGTLATTGDDHTMEISFNSNNNKFKYNGGDLLVDFSIQTATSDWNSMSWSGISTSDNTAYYKYSSYSGSLKFLPTTTINYTPGEAPSCTLVPSGFGFAESYTSATVTWSTEDGESCDIYYSTTNTPAPTQETTPSQAGLTGTNNSYSYNITGLEMGSTYYVWVRVNCDTDEHGNWRSAGSFTTNACNVPTITGVSGLTHNTAVLNWEGDNDSYNIKYRTAAYVTETPLFTENFNTYADEEALEAVWTVNNPNTGETVGLQGDGDNKYFQFSTNNGATANQYLISPVLTNTGMLRFKYKAYVSYGQETFSVGYSTTTNATDQFTFNPATTVTNTAWATYEYELPSDAKYFAIHYTSSNKYYLYIDDIAIYQIQAAGEWQDESSATTNVTLTGLTAATLYDVKVQGVCAGTNGDWSDVYNFTTTALSKAITGYDEGNDKWYLIASPVLSVTPSADNGFITDDNTDPNNCTYDLYYFDQTGGDNHKVWKNYRQNSFNLESGKGYLYANKNDVTLTFDGTPYTGNGVVALSYDSDAEKPGYNLIGNPYATTAYLSVSRDFYRMNEAGSKIVLADGSAISAFEGIFVIAADADDNSVTFVTDPVTSAGPNNSMITLNLTQNRGTTIDNARIRFGEGQMLPKFMLNENNTKLYIPQDNKDYAVVRSNGQGEMPVNFRANENGTYTLTVNAENVEMNYLHLIDNMTGMDIDLLQTPSYTFNATTNDYESRFRLVFAANGIEENESENETFAFFSNGNLVVSNNGQATLQVIDMTGRILSNETINGNANLKLNATQGVYVLRLINGENVKVQKMVVR